MHCVYKLVFTERKQNSEEPYYYIGSKSNATYENGVLLDDRNKPYYGSSSVQNWDEIVENNKISVEIIKEFDSYLDALNFESMLQKSLDVIADTKYFNLAIATVNNYTDPNFATYKNIRTGKTVRLERNHPKVLSGEYVGVSKGIPLSSETKQKISRKGSANPFFGKKHSRETKQKISVKNKGKKISEERKLAFIKNVATMKKTEEHKQKIGRKNLVMLKSKITGECVRVDKSLIYLYNKEEWVNPAVLSKNTALGSKWINNGKENKKLNKNTVIPEGWVFGKLDKRKKNEDTSN